MHRMAMMHLLWKLAWEGTSGAEKDIQHSAVKSSLSLGVPSPFTSSVAVCMKQRDAGRRGKARNGGDRTGREKRDLLPAHHLQPPILTARLPISNTHQSNPISLPLLPDRLPPDSSMLVSPSCTLVPCQLLWLNGFRPLWFKSTKFWMVQKCQSCLEMLGRKAPDTEALTQLSASRKGKEKLLS